MKMESSTKSTMSFLKRMMCNLNWRTTLSLTLIKSNWLHLRCINKGLWITWVKSASDIKSRPKCRINGSQKSSRELSFSALTREKLTWPRSKQTSLASRHLCALASSTRRKTWKLPHGTTTEMVRGADKKNSTRELPWVSSTSRQIAQLKKAWWKL